MVATPKKITKHKKYLKKIKIYNFFLHFVKKRFYIRFFVFKNVIQKKYFFHLYYMSKTDLEKFYLLDFLYCFSPQNIVVPPPSPH